jgi:AcrR family transcriptional regulator
VDWGAYVLANVKFRDGALRKPNTRIERRRRRNREKLLRAAAEVIGEKGIDVATMSEITDRADVASGTVYYYFESKEELSVAVMEWVMDRLGRRIRKVTDTLKDPGRGYAYGCRTVMEVASRDPRWHWLLKRTDVVAETMIRAFGRYGRDDMRKAIEAGRYKVENVELAWRMTIWCLVGVGVDLCKQRRSIAEADAVIDAAVVNILRMLGMDTAEAKIVARGIHLPLAPEE